MILADFADGIADCRFRRWCVDCADEITDFADGVWIVLMRLQISQMVCGLR